MMLKRHWWKALAVVLLAYTLLAGLAVPLGSGIAGVAPVAVKSGQTVQLAVTTYQAHYPSEIGQTKARLRLNRTQAICADSVYVDPQTGQLQVQLHLPEGQLPIDKSQPKRNQKAPFPLLEVYAPKNGYASLESALFVQVGDSSQQAAASAFCAVEEWPSQAGMNFPFLNILEETIRNLFFHVPMWFGMMLILLASVVYSIKHLRQPQQPEHDRKAVALAGVGVLFGVLGLVTGALWANYTWGAPWSGDVKQNTSAVALLIYLAYFVLRGSLEDEDKRARISAIYNIFAFATLIPLLYIIPRLSSSLHPGMDGNPAFSSYDLDNTMRLVFYPSIIAWTLLGVWLASLWVRYDRVWQKVQMRQSNNQGFGA